MCECVVGGGAEGAGGETCLRVIASKSSVRAETGLVWDHPSAVSSQLSPLHFPSLPIIKPTAHGQQISTHHLQRACLTRLAHECFLYTTISPKSDLWQEPRPGIWIPLSHEYGREWNQTSPPTQTVQWIFIVYFKVVHWFPKLSGSHPDKKNKIEYLWIFSVQRAFRLLSSSVGIYWFLCLFIYLLRWEEKKKKKTDKTLARCLWQFSVSFI